VARKKSTTPTEALKEFESLADRIAGWVGQNAVAVGSAVAILLAATGAVSGYRSWTQNAAQDASSDLAEVRNDYRFAMGTAPGVLEIPELANPQAASRVRGEYVERFQGVADEHGGTVQAALALIEVGDLQEASGDAAAAAAAWERARAELPGGSALHGTVLTRMAREHERNERWLEAAQAHEMASEIEDFPLRYWAMADAARCFDRAGDTARALVLLERVDAEAPELQLPDYLRTRLRELRVANRETAAASLAAAP